MRTPADVLRAVRRLRADPQLYARMVENGHRRGAAFTHERITEAWHALLAGPAAADVQRLRARQPIWRGVERWAHFASRVPLHVRNRRRYLDARDHEVTADLEPLYVITRRGSRGSARALKVAD